MRAAACQYDAPNGGTTARAGLAFATVYLVHILEAAAAAFRVHVVGDGGSFALDGRAQNAGHRAVETASAVCAEAGGEGAGMDGGLEQRFVGIDVAHAADEALIQQQRLDAGLAFAQEGEKLGFAQAESIGAEAGDAGGKARGPFDTAELPRIVVDKDAVVEFENRAGVRPGGDIEQEAPGHAEVDDEGSFIEGSDNEFAVAGDGLDGL